MRLLDCNIDIVKGNDCVQYIFCININFIPYVRMTIRFAYLLHLCVVCVVLVRYVLGVWVHVCVCVCVCVCCVLCL